MAEETIYGSATPPPWGVVGGGWFRRRCVLHRGGFLRRRCPHDCRSVKLLAAVGISRSCVGAGAAAGFP
jgi:hypothetical protein